MYQKADNGDITNLIGYSIDNPYEAPTDYDLIVNTSQASDIKKSKEVFTRFMSNILKSSDHKDCYGSLELKLSASQGKLLWWVKVY